MSPRDQQRPTTDAALIGMGCRLPGATSPVELWQVLLDPVRAQNPGLVSDPLTPQVLRQVVWEALADASLPTRTLAGTRTGVYLYAHPTSYTDPAELAADLSGHLRLKGPVRTGPASVPLLHAAHYDLRVGGVDWAIVIAADEHQDLTRAIALVLTSTALADRHRTYAHITGTWSPQNRDEPAHTVSQALHHAGHDLERVWAWHTPAHDPDLVHALNQLPRPYGRGPELCALPGPLAAPGGVRGLVSAAAAALALHHRRLSVPAHPTGGPLGTPNAPSEVHVAGIQDRSSQGTSVTVLTSAPRLPVPAHHDPVSLPQMCTVSAPSLPALAQAARVRAELTPSAGSVTTLADTALDHTDHHRVRAAVVTDNLGGALQGYRSIQDGRPNSHVVGPRVVPPVPPRLVYVLTGLAGVHPNAGAELMRLPEYAEAVEEARQALAEHTAEPVWGPGERLLTVQHRHEATFVSQLALAAAWRARGLAPEAVVGCGAGEPAAAVLAGALSVRDAARVVAARSTALASLPATRLLLIHAPHERVASLLEPLGGRVHVALHLHARAWCVAGPGPDLAALSHTLHDQDEQAQLLRGDAAHTPAALELGPGIRDALRHLRPRPAEHAHLVTATPRPAGQPLLDATYWASQTAAPAHLGAALRLATTHERPSVLVEVTARTTLARTILDTVDARHDAVSLSCDPGQFAHALDR
ncbi:acyltransferase domain-containing protein [Nocardiopsis sp. FR26]|uniref:acyltransferase domain-containing protein n=1 Tax=Nocardiopsis sp. FR26 TaxID=2605987 RepID=UPI00135B426C|nr:acyltransferase domain-containing protein [Nocardiopsis sp. FR26]